MDRKVLKEKAKAAFKANYWNSVGVAFVTTLIAGGGVAASGGGATTVNDPQTSEQGQQAIQKIADQDPKVLLAIFGIFFGIILLVMFIASLYEIFVGLPVKMGNDNFFLKNSEDSTTKFEEIKAGFTPNYGRNVKAFFLKKLYVFLWSLLFVIPGIVKSLGYSMSNYILAEDPEISPKEALKKSEEMMEGHKWELFMFGLSFFGWVFLAALTFGLAGIFYVYPYLDAADAEFYKGLKELN